MLSAECVAKWPAIKKPPVWAAFPLLAGLLRDLLVVLLALDLLALLVLRVLDASALLLGHLAVGHGLVFHFLHVRLALLELFRFLLIQLAGLLALLDAFFLVGLALVDPLGGGRIGGLRGSKTRQRRDHDGNQRGPELHGDSPLGLWNMGRAHLPLNAPASGALTADL